MSKHTPGPWRVSAASTSEFSWVERADGGSKRGHPVVGCDLREDAQLIAAAPELLEALREMTAAHQREDPHHEDLCSNCRLARAAIAKAEGKQ